MIRAVVASLLVVGSYGHSWVACTDYRVQNPTQSPQGPNETDPARRYYDDSKCFGYPRAWEQYKRVFFGDDGGYNHQPSGGPACKTSYGAVGDYTAMFPAARYALGQTVCITHPTKNHVAASCTNPYIPDHGQRFYVAGPNLGADPSLESFVASGALVSYDGEHVTPSFDYKGFQNSPTFCENPDKALATACFQVPSTLVPGRYTFLWHWAFNSPDDVYTTCWEADVGLPVTTPAPVATPVPIATPAPIAAPVAIPTPFPSQLVPTSPRTWARQFSIVVESAQLAQRTVYRTRVST